MSKLFEMAKAATASNGISGKTRIKMEDLIAKYPEGVIVDEFYKLQSQFGEEYYAFVILGKEEYFTETTALKQIAEKWLENMSVDEINASLSLDPIKFKMTRVKTKQGKPFTKVEVFQ